MATPQGARGRNPLTGEIVPVAFIGALVPGTGNRINGAYVNGMAQAGVNGYPRGLIDSRGIHYAPRVGFAWNFMQKTVLRTGFGVFYDRFQGNPVFDMLPNPPSTLSPTVYYGNLSTIRDTPGVLFPQSPIRGFANDRIAPPNIVLDVGQVTETVTVEASAVQLQTESAERSGVVTGVQTVNLAARTSSRPGSSSSAAAKTRPPSPA